MDLPVREIASEANCELFPVHFIHSVLPINELLGVYQLPHQSADLINSSLVNLVDVLLVVPQQGAQDHEDRAGIAVEFSGLTNPI